MIVSSLAVCKSLESSFQVAISSLFDLSGSGSSLVKHEESLLEDSLKLIVSEGQTTDALGGLSSTIGNVLDRASVFGSVPWVLADFSGLGTLLTGDVEFEAGLHAFLRLGDALGSLNTDRGSHRRGVIETGVAVLERGVADLSCLGTWSLDLIAVVCFDAHPYDIIGNLDHFGLITKES